MALADILDSIADLVDGTDATNVYRYQPIMVSSTNIPSTLKSGGIIHFWSVTREGTTETRLNNVETQRNHSIVVRGYYEVGDASTSEPVFQALVEAVMLAFRAVYQLSAPASVEWLQPGQASAIGPRMLSETFLVHYVEIRLDAQERVTP